MVKLGYAQLTQIVTYQEASAEEQEKYEREKVGDVKILNFWRGTLAHVQSIKWQTHRSWCFLNMICSICSYRKSIMGCYKKLFHMISSKMPFFLTERVRWILKSRAVASLAVVVWVIQGLCTHTHLCQDCIPTQLFRVTIGICNPSDSLAKKCWFCCTKH